MQDENTVINADAINHVESFEIVLKSSRCGHVHVHVVQ